MSGAVAQRVQRHPMWDAPLPFLMELARRQPDLAQFWFDGHPHFLAVHPDWVREVLVTRQPQFGRYSIEAHGPETENSVTLDGERHRKLRPAVAASLRGDILNRASGVAQEEVRRFAEELDSGRLHDMEVLLSPLVTRVLARVLLDEHDVRALHIAQELIRARLMARGEVPGTEIEARELSQSIDDFLLSFIADERRVRRNTTVVGRQASEGLDDVQIRNEIKGSFLAGHSVVMPMLVWAFYRLVRSPELLRELREDRQVSYVRWVLNESLRMYPPLWFTSRLALIDQNLGPLRVPRGSVVYVCPFITQRDERFFREPNRFDPKRWKSYVREGRSPMAFFPFGGGIHRCAGEALSRVLGCELLGALTRQFEFIRSDSWPVEVKALPGRPLLMAQKFWASITKV